VHVLHGVEVPGRDHDEVGRDGLGLDHRARGALGLARDREFALLDRRHEVLLAPDVERVDLVDEQHALVRLVDGARLDAVVAGRLHPTGLERVVPNVAEQRAGVRAGRVAERRSLRVAVVHQQVRDHRVRPAVQVAEDEVDDPGGDDADEDLADDDERVAQHDGDDDPHQQRPHLVALARLLAVRVDDLVALAGGHRPDLRFVTVVRVVVDQHVLQLLFREQLGHRLREHRLPGPGRTDHHHVAALFGRLDDHVAGVLLSDDLVDESVGDLELGSRIDLESAKQVVLVGIFVNIGAFDLD